MQNTRGNAGFRGTWPALFSKRAALTAEYAQAKYTGKCRFPGYPAGPFLEARSVDRGVRAVARGARLEHDQARLEVALSEVVLLGETHEPEPRGRGRAEWQGRGAAGRAAPPAPQPSTPCRVHPRAPAPLDQDCVEARNRVGFSGRSPKKHRFYRSKPEIASSFPARDVTSRSLPRQSRSFGLRTLPASATLSRAGKLRSNLVRARRLHCSRREGGPPKGTLAVA